MKIIFLILFAGCVFFLLGFNPYSLLLVVVVLVMVCSRKRVLEVNVDEMEGIAFEHYVANIYRKLGYKVKVTAPSGDFGADLVMSKGREKICVQCKRYKSYVGISAVQEVIGSLNYYQANKGYVVTNSEYTRAAKELAKANQIKLVNGKELRKLSIKAKNST